MTRRREGRWSPVGETVQEWIERVGYCFHHPTCTDSAACRVKRALERATSKASTVYSGEAAMPRKLDWDE